MGSPASAASAPSAQPQVVRVTVHLPALVLDNLCNADVVNLSGDLEIVTVTAPYQGGFVVVSRSAAKNLTGSRIAPPPMIGYKGEDTENSYAYYAPPPYPSTFSVLHWTKLVPEGKAPTMWLVVVTQETVMADGTTVPVVDRAYLTCTEPKDHRGSTPSSR
jgi:hypothetical protein